MKRFVSLALMLGASGPVLLAGTVPLWENNSPISFPYPQVDATAFVNHSDFTVSSIGFYDFSNCLNYTNDQSGTMFASLGFRFDFVTNHFRYPAANFVNYGVVDSSDVMLILATNIISTGDMGVGERGRLLLSAANVADLGGAALRSGQTGLELFLGSSFLTSTNYYVNDPGVYDIYWGIGNNNRLDNQGRPMFLNSSTNSYSTPNFGVPNASSPDHQVQLIDQGFQMTTFVTVPEFTTFFFGLSNVVSGALYDAFVYTNVINDTNWVVQMVFAPTNSMDTNFHTQVSFSPDYANNRAAIEVVFYTTEYDIVLGQDVTHAVYLTDLTAARTNLYLLNNTNTGVFTHRPSSLMVTRESALFGIGFSTNFYNYYSGNAVFTPELVYNPTYYTNQVNVTYTAYAAQVGDAAPEDLTSANSPFLFNTFFFFTPAVIEPTNMAGRVEISANQLNLDRARIRSESVFKIQTQNLASNVVGQVDAPFLIYDLRSIEPTLLISNLAPATVNRLVGHVSAWSGIWVNYMTNVTTTITNFLTGAGTTNTNVITINFNALVVENGLQSKRSVFLHELDAHCTNNLVIADNLLIGESLLLDAPNLDVTGVLTLPGTSDWANTNIQNLVNLTNEGTILIPGTAYLGDAPSQPYSNVVNHGIITTGASIKVRTGYFENASSPFVAGSGSMASGAGLISINAATALLTNSQLSANGSITINASQLSSRNSTISAGNSNVGTLTLSVSNRLSDEGVDATNYWLVTGGFSLPRKPLTGDLLGTTLESRIIRLFGQVSHVCSAENRGASPAGYTNNLALGRLVLDGGTNNGRFIFSGAVSNQAIYVDYLELRNTATNYHSSLVVNPGFTLYFANANVPPGKLDGLQNGRLRWVSSFAGPNSSTNITYPSGNSYTFNIALAEAVDLDSNGNGSANRDDPLPFYVPENVDLRVAFTKQPAVKLTWNALAFVPNVVEFKTDLDAPTWQVLTNFIGAFPTAPVTVTDAVPPSTARFYRVRVQTPYSINLAPSPQTE